MTDEMKFIEKAFDDDALGFDPLGAFEGNAEGAAGEEEHEEGYVGEPHEPQEAIPDLRPAAERIADLFASMDPCRRTLMGLLAFCETSQPVSAFDGEVARLQEDNFSVYSPASLAELLEAAGALDRVTEDGQPYPKEAGEPRLVEEEGMSYYEVSEAPEAYLLTTQEGRDFLNADKPRERMAELFQKESRYAPIYRTLLTLCAQDGGASVSDLSTAVDDDELMQEPRYYAAHFIGRLERCHALEWSGKRWHITETGNEGRAMLEDAMAERGDNAGKEGTGR